MTKSNAQGLAAKQPHALAKLKRAVQDELKPEIERQVRHQLTRTTRRAMLAQRRAQARRQAAGSNRPPERVKFTQRPPAAIWHLPDDPSHWEAVERLLVQFEPMDFCRSVTSSSFS